MNGLRVLAVASDQLARAGLAALLSQQPGTLTLDQAGGDEDLQTILGAYRPDVVLWDLGWSPAGDLERMSQLPENAPPVLALIPDDSHAAETWAAGVKGLLPRVWWCWTRHWPAPLLRLGLCPRDPCPS